MNKYTFTILFNNHWYFLKFTANQLANSVLPHDDDILEWVCPDNDQNFGVVFKGVDGVEYEATWEEPGKLSIYINDGKLVRKNIPFLLLKVEDKNGEELYNINDA